MSIYHGDDGVVNKKLLNSEVPTYYVAEGYVKRRVKKETFWDNIGFNHPKRVGDKEEAFFHIIYVYDHKTLRDNLNLPTRESNKPYLCFIRINLDGRSYNHSFFRRKDIIFVTFDLGDCVLLTDNQMILSGVTIPSCAEYDGKERKISPVNKYLISFKGDCDQVGLWGCCDVRKKMKKLFAANEDERILFEDIADEGVDRSREQYMEILRNSTFCFALHGHGRWSHRFTEIIGAGAIPVIVADGLTLPFEQLIDYSQICIKIPKKYANEATNVSEILEKLPSDAKEIEEMMRKIKLVNELCFKNKNIRMNSLLLSAKREFLRRSKTEG